ncbi:MAG: nucleotide kinase domain-containing protein, partial [Phocaeicola sp.]
ESRFVLLWNELMQRDLASLILACETAEDSFNAIRTLKGYKGDFLSYQIYVDLTYAKEFKFSEEDFGISGLGCKQGIEFLFGDEKRSITAIGMTHDELLYWTRYNIDRLLLENGVDLKELMCDLPLEERKISLSNVENLFCELAKLCKHAFLLKRRTRLYKYQESDSLF